MANGSLQNVDLGNVGAYYEISEIFWMNLVFVPLLFIPLYFSRSDFENKGLCSSVGLGFYHSQPLKMSSRPTLEMFEPIAE